MDAFSADEIKSLKEECKNQIKKDELYDVRNSAKLRAVNAVKSYDEFQDIVDAAHLRPLDKRDKMDSSTKKRLWNQTADAD